jgi:hypothetical protein
MTLRFEDLGPAIERNDGRAVARYLIGATEAERRTVNPKVRALCAKDWNSFPDGRSASFVAILGTAQGIRQVTAVLGQIGVWTEQAIAVLHDRRPAWMSELPKALLTGNEFGNEWTFVRALIRAGLVPKPDIPEYTTLMPQGLAHRMMLGPPYEAPDTTLEKELLEDRDLLDDEVFRLFRVEGAGRNLYWADSWIGERRTLQDGKPVQAPPRSEATWRGTLARLARAGSIDFDRLLDECIGAFVREFKPSGLGWYVGLHDELAPTVDEMAARADQYLLLLAADTSIGVGVGQRALEVLLRSGRLDLERFVAASGPALHRSEKGVVLKQLKLLSLALKQRPDLASLIGGAISPALAHERPDIQDAARKLADGLPGDHAPVAPKATGREARPTTIGDEREVRLLSRAAQVMDGSPWAPVIRATVEATESGAAPQAWNVPIGPGAPLPKSIQDPEELVEAFTRLVEDASDPILVERALAGAVRTAHIPIAVRKRLAEPLAKRAHEQLPGWPSALTGGAVRAMVASVAYAWATGNRVAAGFTDGGRDFELQHSCVDKELRPVTPTGVFAVRALEAIYLIAQGSQVELLSEPTHERGAIDPDVFIERAVKSYGSMLGPMPPRYDLELAVLRIAPGELDARMGKLPRRVKNRVSVLVREVPVAIRATIVSGRPTDPWGNHTEPVVLAKVGVLGRDSKILRTLTNLDQPVASHLRLAGEGEFITGYGPSIRTWPLIAPWHPELTAAHLLRPLSRALHPGKHDYGPSAAACLMHADTPLGSVGHVALALASIGAEADTRTSAADVFAAASRDGRLQPASMAEGWLELARDGVFQAKRLEATLRPLVSHPASGVRIAQSLQLALGPLIAAGGRDLHVLLRLAASVGSTYGVFPDDARVGALADRKAGSELTAAARALASARAVTVLDAKAANLDLLDGLLERAGGISSPFRAG